MTGQIASAIAVILALALSAALWRVSHAYRPRFASRSRMVMNWGWDGKPVRWASPRLGLAITPAVGTLTLLGTAGLTLFATPDPDRMAAAGMILFMGVVLIAIHAAHLHFSARAGDGCP